MAAPSPPHRRSTRGGARPEGEEGDRPARVKLTEAEKAVLVECRRASIVRGLPLGVGSVILLRWLIVQGRVPQHIKRWSWVYYGVSFTISFFMGVRSYQPTCFKKIMALENSVLADQIRQYEDKVKGYGTWDESETSKSTDQSQTKAKRGSHHQHTPPTVTLSPPSQPQVDARERRHQASDDEQQQQQPDAFTSPDHSTTTLASQEETMSRSKTFDEIREESRRKQLQQNYPRPSGQRGRGDDGRVEERDWRQPKQQSGPGRPVRRNKYGDEVPDED